MLVGDQESLKSGPAVIPITAPVLHNQALRRIRKSRLCLLLSSMGLCIIMGNANALYVNANNMPREFATKRSIISPGCPEPSTSPQ